MCPPLQFYKSFPQTIIHAFATKVVSLPRSSWLMRYSFIFLLIIACLSKAQAQVVASADSLANKEQKLDSLKQKISSFDKAEASGEHRVDSLLAQTQSADSVLLKPEQKLNDLEQHFYRTSDSLKLTFKSKLSGLDKAGTSTQHQIDSLTSLHLPTEKYTHRLDSINQEKNAAVHSLDEKINSLKSKTTGQLKQFNFPPELNDKVSAVTKNVEGFKLPVKDLNIPSLNLPDNPLKSLDGLNSSIKTSFGEVGNIGSLQGLSGSLKNIGQIGNIDGLKGLQNNLGDVSKVTGQMGNYQQDIQNITKGNLGELKAAPKALETKAADMAGIKDLQKEAGGVMDPLKQVTGSVQNPEAAKEQALQKVQEVAVNHFAGKEEVLQQAMNKVAKYKQKYSSLNSLSEIGKKRPNEMHGKPFIERVVPAFHFRY
jgi:predicted  nucleic acid-binding Zn-ribbon protein